MLLALVVAVASVALGAVLGGLSAGATTRAVGPVQIFALAAALAVVLAHLLPEAYARAGPATLLAFAAAFALPVAIDHLTRRLRSSETGLGHSIYGLEAGYAGLLMHKVGDGLALGAATGALLTTEHPTGIVVAVAGHTVPLTALVVIAFERMRGLRHALGRAAGLGVAMVVGVLVTRAVPAEQVAPWQPWATAVVAGLLLHVVTHGWQRHRPRTMGSWLLHGLAAVAGVAIVLVGGH